MNQKRCEEFQRSQKWCEDFSQEVRGEMQKIASRNTHTMACGKKRSFFFNKTKTETRKSSSKRIIFPKQSGGLASSLRC